MHKKAYTMAQVHKNSLFASPRSCTAVSRPGSAPDPPGKAPWTRSTRPPRLCRNNVWKKITWAYSPALEVAAIVEYTHNTLCKLDIWDLFSVTVIYDYFDKWRLFKHICTQPYFFVSNPKGLNLWKVCSCQCVRNGSISFCEVVCPKLPLTTVVFMFLGFKEILKVPAVDINVKFTLRCPEMI